MSGLKVLAIYGQLKHSRIDNFQTSIIAKELSKDGTLYKKEVFFNVFINFAILRAILPIWLFIKKEDDFKDVEECDVIVVSGRKMIRFAKHLRKNMFPGVKIVQIGNPYCNINKNDILLRQETSRYIATCKNTIKINGLLSRKIKPDVAQKEMQKFSKITDILKGEYISVFIGKNMFGFKLYDAEVKEFAKTISKISYNHKMPLLILTDRKVKKNIIDTIKQNLDCSYYFFENKNPIEGPKIAFMSWAKYYILLGNSINDHSEYIAQEKPTYIYKSIKNTKRYNKFLEIAVANHSAKILTPDMETIEEYKSKTLNNIPEICDKIKAILNN